MLSFPFTPDFHLSDAQQEHALAIEDLAPRLSALRVKLCPDHMTETSFWKIYFVHLHPKLEHNAAKLLSTPKVSMLVLISIDSFPDSWIVIYMILILYADCESQILVTT